MSEMPEEHMAQTEAEPQAMVVADRDCIIREWNSAAARIFGYSEVDDLETGRGGEGGARGQDQPGDGGRDHWSPRL